MTNIIFIILFTCEMVLKMYSLGFSVSSKLLNLYSYIIGILLIFVNFNSCSAISSLFSTGSTVSQQLAALWKWFWWKRMWFLPSGCLSSDAFVSSGFSKWQSTHEVQWIRSVQWSSCGLGQCSCQTESTAKYSFFCSLLKVLEVVVQFGGVTAQLHPVDCVPSVPPLFVHHDFCPARDASVWRKV